MHSLELLITDNPTVKLIQQGVDMVDEENIHREREQQLATREEADYQRMIADSLSIPYISPVTPTPASGSSSMAPNAVCTIPYCLLKITQHLNGDWMQPKKDDTNKTRHIVKGNLDNCFTVVFWGKV